MKAQKTPLAKTRAISAGTASASNYGDSLITLFPALVTRSAAEQAGYQLAAIALVLANGVFCAFITFLFLRMDCFNQKLDEFYEDKLFWIIEDLEENSEKKEFVHQKVEKLEGKTESAQKVETDDNILQTEKNEKIQHIQLPVTTTARN